MLQGHIISEHRFRVNNLSITYSDLIFKSSGEKSEKEWFTSNINT